MMEEDLDSSSGSETEESSYADTTYYPGAHQSAENLWGNGYSYCINDDETESVDKSHHDSPDASRKQRSEESDSDQDYDSASDTNTESDSEEDTSTDIPDANSGQNSGVRTRSQTLAKTERRYMHHYRGGQGYHNQRRKKKKRSQYKRQSCQRSQKQPHREQAEPIEVTQSEIKEALKNFRFKSEQSDDDVIAVVENILQGVSVLAEVFSDELRALCYLVAAYICTQRSHSLVLYISHLKILIKDESERWCFPALLKVACLDEDSQKDQILLQVNRREVDILLLTPEMLESIAYSKHIELPPISFACIDHAECILEMQRFRPAYLRLNQLLRVKLNVPCIMGLMAAATPSSVQALIKQLDFEFPRLEGRLLIPHGKVKLNVSFGDKKKALQKLLQQSSGRPRSIIIICQSQNESHEVTEMLKGYFSSVALGLKENSSTAANATSGSRKRKISGDPQAKRHKATVPVVKCYLSTMLPAAAEKIRKDFAQQKVGIVVTTFPYAMSLQRADAVIYFTMPSSCESLRTGGFQVARSEQQEYVHVLLDKEDEKYQLPLQGIPPCNTLYKQVQRILARRKVRAIRGVNQKCLWFLLGRLESLGYLELPGRISNPPSDVKTCRKPVGNQLKSLCKSLYEELSDFMVPAELKELHKQLKSIAFRHQEDRHMDLFSIVSPTQGKQHNEKTLLLGSQSTPPGTSSHDQQCTMLKERPESKVIQKNYTKIAQNITAQRLTQWFASKLTEEDFIANPSFFSVMGVAAFDQVIQMLEAVETKLKTKDSPQEMLKFINILQDSPPLEQLASQITSEYESYGGTTFQSYSGACGSSSIKVNAPPAPIAEAQEHTDQPGETADEVTVTQTSRKTSGRGRKVDNKENGMIQKEILHYFERK